VGYRSAGWSWSKVSSIHRAREGEASGCVGEIYSYRYRVHPASGGLYKRCVGLAWCSTCREYCAAMVFVPRGEYLPDLLAELPALEHERLVRSEVKLLDYLDRLVRGYVA
jgi:hypothetical protein